MKQLSLTTTLDTVIIYAYLKWIIGRGDGIEILTHMLDSRAWRFAYKFFEIVAHLKNQKIMQFGSRVIVIDKLDQVIGFNKTC